MRTYDERVEELHRRMTTRKESKSHRRYLVQSGIIGTVCLAMTVLLALAVAHTPIQSADAGDSGVTASIFTNHAALGYVVVALVAFCLGTLVTVFCFRLRMHMEKKSDADRDH